jgi:hypothetical protein
MEAVMLIFGREGPPGVSKNGVSPDKSQSKRSEII